MKRTDGTEIQGDRDKQRDRDEETDRRTHGETERRRRRDLEPKKWKEDTKSRRAGETGR